LAVLANQLMLITATCGMFYF